VARYGAARSDPSRIQAARRDDLDRVTFLPGGGNGAHLLSETSHNATRQAPAAEPGDPSMVS